jgi:hypothetical protein
VTINSATCPSAGCSAGATNGATAPRPSTGSKHRADTIRTKPLFHRRAEGVQFARDPIVLLHDLPSLATGTIVRRRGDGVDRRCGPRRQAWDAHGIGGPLYLHPGAVGLRGAGFSRAEPRWKAATKRPGYTTWSSFTGGSVLENW